MSRLGHVVLATAVLWSLVGCDKQATDGTVDPASSAPAARIVLQLNWLHDPTFAGEYLLAKRSDMGVVLKEGGPNVSSVTEVLTGRATAAVMGADIFLQAIFEDVKAGRPPRLTCMFVDFQRNPVGWILHPDAAAKAGYEAQFGANPSALNQWLVDQLESGTLRIGDKRGTETTAVWMKWKAVRRISDKVTVTPVGFDAAMVLAAPMLAYPVYLNEEPYSLSHTIGRPVVVIDPAVDGVSLYGNVIAVKTSLVETANELVAQLQRGLREGWTAAVNDPATATAVVSEFYKGGDQNVVAQQIGRTLEFVRYQGVEPGEMDIGVGGRWQQTLEAVRATGLVDQRLSFDVLRRQLRPISQPTR